MMTSNLTWTREGRMIAALCWIAVGLVFLPINFNLVRPELLAQLWKLWPLIPLAVGVTTLLSIGPWPTSEKK